MLTSRYYSEVVLYNLIFITFRKVIHIVIVISITDIKFMKISQSEYIKFERSIRIIKSPKTNTKKSKALCIQSDNICYKILYATQTTLLFISCLNKSAVSFFWLNQTVLSWVPFCCKTVVVYVSMNTVQVVWVQLGYCLKKNNFLSALSEGRVHVVLLLSIVFF